jgi:hypothetical protein
VVAAAVVVVTPASVVLVGTVLVVVDVDAVVDVVEDEDVVVVPEVVVLVPEVVVVVLGDAVVVVVLGDVVVVVVLGDVVVVVVLGEVVVVAAVVDVVAAVVLVLPDVVVGVGAVVVVVDVGRVASVDGNGVIELKTKLLTVQLDGSSPTQIEQGSGGVLAVNEPGEGETSKPSSQLTVELLSKPLGLVLLESSTSGVVSGLPVGRIQRSIVNVTLPSAAGVTGVPLPGLEVCNVPPSHEPGPVGSRLHSSNLSGSPAMKVVLAPIVTVMTPASPSYACSPAAANAGAVCTVVGVTVIPVVCWADAKPAAAVPTAPSKHSAPTDRDRRDNPSGIRALTGNLRSLGTAKGLGPKRTLGPHPDVPLPTLLLG